MFESLHKQYAIKLTCYVILSSIHVMWYGYVILSSTYSKKEQWKESDIL